MYEELVKRLREPCQYENCVLCKEAADAIEELIREYDSIAASLTESVELVRKLNKQIEELQKQVAYWQAQLTKSMCGETLAELEKPRWVSVTERLPEEKPASYLCLTEGGYCKEVRWTNIIYGLVESDNWGWSIFDVPQFSHVTHWMPLPPAPEPPKEET